MRDSISTVKRELRIAIAGCGALARSVHIPLLARMPGVRITAIADTDGDALESAGRSVPGAERHKGYQSLLAAETVDAVVIASSPGTHAAAAVAAFDKGSSVYLEKPLAATLSDGDSIVSAWRRAGTVGMIGFNYRFNPLYVRLKRELESERIGQVVAVRSVFSTASRPLPEWKKSRASGGGVLLDLGSHHVDLIRFLLGQEVKQSIAHLRSIRSEHDTATLELTTTGGISVQSFFSLNAVDEDRIEIYGDNGKLVVDRMASLDVEHFPSSSRRADRVLRLGRRLLGLRNAAHILAKLRSPMNEPSFRASLDHFVSAIRGGTNASPGIDDGYASLAAIVTAEAARPASDPLSHIDVTIPADISRSGYLSR